jgi:hypothetical protein
MAKKYAMWVHGTAAVPELMAGDAGADGPLLQVDHVPKSDYVGLHQGRGVRFRGKANHGNWFHFSIPTPVIAGDAPARLETAFVLYESTRNLVSVDAVHVFDGPNRLYEAPMPGGAATSGDHGGAGRPGTADGRRYIEGTENVTRFTVPGRPPIIWGVGLSVHVFFAQEGEIQFTTAGADFLVGAD